MAATSACEIGRIVAPRGAAGRSAGDPPATSRTGAPSGAVAGDQEAERRAAAGGAGELDEGEVVASGEDPDPSGRDGRPAGGARGAVGERAGTIAGTHRRPV